MVDKGIKLKAPFPYWGGKSRAAKLIWERFGPVTSYIEPFAGSLAVLLSCPYGQRPREVVNDLDSRVANFWRALRGDPEEVAYWADWPTSHADLIARKSYCIERDEELQQALDADSDRLLTWLEQAEADSGGGHLTAALAADSEFYDAQLAGYWVWCVSNDIGLFSERGKANRSRPEFGGRAGGVGIQAQTTDEVINPAGGFDLSGHSRPICGHQGGGQGVSAQAEPPDGLPQTMPNVNASGGGKGVMQAGAGGDNIPCLRGGQGVQAQVGGMIHVKTPAGGQGVSAQAAPHVNADSYGQGIQAQVGSGIPMVRGLSGLASNGRGVTAQAGLNGSRPLVNGRHRSTGNNGCGVAAQTSHEAIPRLHPSHAGANGGVQGLGDGAAGAGFPAILSHPGRKGVGEPQAPGYIPTDGNRLIPWFNALRQRLSRTYILCKDWRTLCSPTILGLTPSDIAKPNPPITGIFFDPPYATKGRKDLYNRDDSLVALAVQQEAIRLADKHYPLCRVAVAGYKDDYAPWPEGWTAVTWSESQIRMGAESKAEYDRSEVIWFSPSCLDPDAVKPQADFLQQLGV